MYGFFFSFSWIVLSRKNLIEKLKKEKINEEVSIELEMEFYYYLHECTNEHITNQSSILLDLRRNQAIMPGRRKVAHFSHIDIVL